MATPAEALNLVVSGRFAACILTPFGHSAMVSIHGPGDAFGEVALLPPGSRRSATIYALEAGETFSVLRDDFFAFADRNPGVKDVLLALLAEHIRRSNERIAIAHYLDAGTRVRWALVQSADFYRSATETVIPLIQEQLAQFAGTARTTVNRVLREEEDRGTVTLERRRVRVLDAEEIGRHVRPQVRA
jgi:CRP/FNR family cyclic AMP-dependent transcriptional regulator